MKIRDTYSLTVKLHSLPQDRTRPMVKARDCGRAQRLGPLEISRDALKNSRRLQQIKMLNNKRLATNTFQTFACKCSRRRSSSPEPTYMQKNQSSLQNFIRPYSRPHNVLQRGRNKFFRNLTLWSHYVAMTST